MFRRGLHRSEVGEINLLVGHRVTAGLYRLPMVVDLAWCLFFGRAWRRGVAGRIVGGRPVVRRFLQIEHDVQGRLAASDTKSVSAWGAE